MHIDDKIDDCTRLKYEPIFSCFVIQLNYLSQIDVDMVEYIFLLQVQVSFH